MAALSGRLAKGAVAPLAQWHLDKKRSSLPRLLRDLLERCQGWLTSNASQSALRLVALWLKTTTTPRNPTARCVLYRIEALLQDKTYDHRIDGYHSS